MNKILHGLKVLDLSRLIPGPVCTLIMADYGAEVIKIEDTWAGDQARQLGPMADRDSALFWQLNRNKKSVALNLKTPEGADILKGLARESDVIMEGFRPGVMKRLGLDYEVISSINKKIVYVSLTGFGQDGPAALKGSHDINYMSLTGLLDLNRCAGSPPEVSSLQVGDMGGGAQMALAAVMMALFYRERTGEGQYVDVSMTDGLMPWMMYAYAYMSGENGEIPRRDRADITGYYACYNIYSAADGKYMSIAAMEPVFWERFCRFANRPDWLTKQYVKEEQGNLKKELADFFAGKTRSQWMEQLRHEDFCCEPVLSIDEVEKHPQIAHREFFTETERDGGKKVRQIGFPLRFSADRGSIKRPPPHLGEHTREIMLENGFSLADIEAYLEQGIIK